MQNDFKKIHTFSPQYSSKYASQQEDRNFEQWLNDQESQSKKLKEKMNILRIEKEKEDALIYTKTPYINDISKKIVEAKANETEAERLAKQKKKREKIEAKNPKSKVVKIPEKEKAAHALSLYNDYEKKKKRIKMLANKFEDVKDNNMVRLKPSSKKFVLRNFVKQFKAEINNIFEDIKEGEKSQLNLIQLVSFFKNMRLISDSDMVEYADQNLGSGDETTQNNMLSISMSVNLT